MIVRMIFSAILRHFTTLAPWRVLGIDKCGSLRSPQPSTRHGKDNKNKTENQTESAAARSRPR